MKRSSLIFSDKLIFSVKVSHVIETVEYQTSSLITWSILTLKMSVERQHKKVPEAYFAEKFLNLNNR